MQDPSHRNKDDRRQPNIFSTKLLRQLRKKIRPTQSDQVNPGLLNKERDLYINDLT